MPTLFWLAGEPSGDLQAAPIARALHQLRPDLKQVGWGGVHLESAGVSLLRNLDSLKIMGFVEVLQKLPRLLGAFNEVKKQLLEVRPEVLVLVDYPGMNLRVARFAKEHGIQVVYYILPKVWAWKSGRAAKLQAYCDELLSILPFEASWYKERNIPITYVGNPLAERLSDFDNYDGSSRQILLLPGSRSQELKHLWPVMGQFAERWPEWDFILVRPLDAKPMPSILPKNVREVFGMPDRDDRFRTALVCSGTATLEIALRGVPQLVLYKAHPLSLFIAKRFVKVSHFSLPNLILNRTAVPELLQEATAHRSLDAHFQLLLDRPDEQLEALRELKERLLMHDPATTAAEHIIRKIH